MDDNNTPPGQALTLDAAARKALKARAHPLKPVVMISDAGLSASVMAEIELALNSHELIKIRVFGDDREARAEMLAQICDRTGSAPVQHIGKLLVIWRPAPEGEASAAPKARRKPNAPYQPKKAAGAGQRAPSSKPRRSRPLDDAPGAGDRASTARAPSARPLSDGKRPTGRVSPLARGAALGRQSSGGGRGREDGDEAPRGARRPGAPTSIAKPLRPGRAPALVSPGQRLRSTIARKKTSR